MARALCELQLELKCRSTVEDFGPKTPEPRELKRKWGKKKKVVLKLETKFMQSEAKLVEHTKPATQSIQSQEQETPSNILLRTEDSHDGSIPNEIGDFPTPEELATLNAVFLAKRCRLGYRAQRILSLAQNIVQGKLELRKLEEAYHVHEFVSGGYDELDRQLSCISGFGPFTRANVLMCMGFYHRIPADTETVRHLKQFHARKKCTIRSVQNDVEFIYEKYAPFQFLVYWSELWDYYEQRFGKSSEMLPSDYRVITASKMKPKISRKR